MTSSIKRWREEVPETAPVEHQIAAADAEIACLRQRLEELQSKLSSGAEAGPTEEASEDLLAAPPIVVTSVTNPWKDHSVLRPELLGQWKVIPLSMGDGTVIMTKDMTHVIARFSDYATAQVLAALHNASTDSGSSGATTTQWLREKAQDAGFVLTAGDMLVVPAPHYDATPYLSKFANLLKQTGGTK